MRIILLIFTLIIVSCSQKEDSNSAQDAVNDVCEQEIFGPCIDPIENFQYSANQLVLSRNQAPIFVVPTYTSTVATPVEFYPNVSLPEGLSLNRDSGIISGSPTTIQEEQDYIIIVRYSDDTIKQQFDARGGGGLRTYTISIRVLDIPPANIQYSNSELIVERRENIPDIQITTLEGGPVTSYEVSPALPEGILFNSETGEIEGSPVSEQPRTQYVVTAKNSGGQTSTSIFITVTGRSPENLNYLDNNISYLAGIPLSRENLPIYSGDTATTFSINPVLPLGMIFDTTTGVISGNPSQVISNQDYTITANNEWGNSQGQITLSVLDNITGISTGLNHTCVIKNKKVSCSGRNEFNQLGRVASDTCLDDNNDTYPCEKGFDYVLMNTSPLEALSLVSTRSSNCALGEDKKVYCWGDNLFGQLGTNDSASNNIVPDTVKIDTLGTELTNVDSISAGNLHVCAKTSLGKAYCWGDNSRGQLSNSVLTTSNYAIPVNRNSLEINNVTAVTAGYEHSCVITNGNVECWGNNDEGQLSTGDTNSITDSLVFAIDTADDILDNITQMILGRSFSLFINDSNQISSVGNNDEGQLATGDTLSRLKTGLTNGPIVSDKVFNGDNSFCFINSDTTGSCVGRNNFNFGRGTATGINTTPVSILNEAGDADMTNITLISSGYSRHRCLARQGELYCFGKNDMGQLGEGSVSDVLLPTLITVPQ